jgi:hypothetical protein
MGGRWQANCNDTDNNSTVPDRLFGLQSENMKREGVQGMIKFVNRLSMFVLIGVIANGVALAKTTKKEITFSQPVVVNGTVVKKGTYDAVFDDQTNELTIVKGGKVVAKAPAQLETQDRNHEDYVAREEDGDPTRMTLLSVTLKDRKKATLVDNGNGNSAQ